jgi:AraC-like DNA-binding protein
MLIRFHRPAEPLATFVELIWLYDGIGSSHGQEQLMPSGTIELVVNLREDSVEVFDQNPNVPRHKLTGAIISGPQSGSFVIETRHRTSVLGIHFKPGGLFPFLPFPVSELLDQHLSLFEVWGSEGTNLRARLLECQLPEIKFLLLENFLWQQRRRDLAFHPAVAAGIARLQAAPNVAIAELCAELGISQRHFIERFHREIGLSPKLFSRLARFQSVMKQLKLNPSRADIAVTGGYYDQAHFNHDFRKFAGMTPSAYLARVGAEPNHVPL